jgi:hypothetical protein
MMTTHESCYHEDASSSPASKLLALVMLALLALLAASWLALQVVNREHAVAKHGEQASQIRKCLDSNGPDQVWKFTSHRRDNHYIQCIKMDNGNDDPGDDHWGIRIIQRLKDGNYQERTSFVIKDGTRQQLIEYVTARAEQFFGALP